MSDTYRELTPEEKRQTKKLVTSLCANYDKKYGCLPLDCECYMFGIAYTNSVLCNYFKTAVLPTEPELLNVFQPVELTACRECGKGFIKVGNRVYCSDECAKKARRRQIADSVRKHRSK